MYRIDVFEVERILESHNLWLEGSPDGIQANLSRADLSKANLSGANLSRAYLSRADLSGANLSCANLSCANLSCANLSWAKLSGANLSGTNLSGANLFGANLSKANLSGANLFESHLDLASWPLWCKSFNVKADDRLVSQLFAHVVRLDVTGCSQDVQDQVQMLRKMSLANMFCKFQREVEEIK